MSIYSLRTVCTPSPLPPKPEAKIKAPLSETYYAELLAKDAEKVRARHGGRNSVLQGIGSVVVTEEMRIKLREATLAKGKERMEELLKVLRKPMTVDDMIIKTGWSKTTVRRALNKAHNENRVILTHKKAPQVWERRREAAE